MKDRVTKWLAIVAGSTAVLITAGVVYQTFGSRRDKRRHPPLGNRIGDDGQRLHLFVSGSGQPTVVLDAGIAATSISWQPVHQQIAKFTRVASYDRAGLGWSDEARTARTLRNLVAELRATLRNAALPTPYVLIGHSFGSLVVRAFAHWHPDEVAGLVLVDPVLPAEWIDPAPAQRRRLRNGVMLSKRGAWLAQLGVVRASLAMLTSGARFLPRVIAQATSGPGNSLIQRMVGQVRKLPPEFWPVIRSHWSEPRSFRVMAAYLQALPAAAALAQSLGNATIPLTIVSAADATCDQIDEWNRLTALVPFGRHVQSLTGGHWVQLDDPELVVESILEQVNRLRQGA